MRSLAFALAFAVLALLTGCAGKGEVSLSAWTFEGPQKERATIMLPAHFDAYLPAATSHYRLSAAVSLPEALRDRPLTLVIPRFAGHTVLTVDGALAVSLEGPEPPGYRALGPHAWRIPAGATADGSLDLAMDIEHTWTQSGWFDTVPRLCADLDGGRAFVLQRAFNRASAMCGLAVTLFVGYLYLVVFLTDRRRSSYGWFALTGLAGVGYPVFQLGLLEPYAGPFDALLAGVSVSSAVIAEMHFAASYFGLPRPARAWNLGYLGAVLATIASIGYFRTRAGGAWTAAITVPALIAEALLFLRLIRQKPRPRYLLMVLGGWPFTLFATAPDFGAWLGTGELLGGTRTACLGIAVIGLLQTTAMSRAHTQSLRDADDLNAELRRQIEARSRELAEAIARLGMARGAPALEPGEVVDERYAVVRPLGAGAGGAVYLVERLSDGAELAMKVVHGGDDPQRLARLAREAQLAAQVKHENVIAIVDVEVASRGFLYIVMAYLPGATLREHKDEYGDLDFALPVLTQLAAGLAATHAHGIVHRDLKPSNVLVHVPRLGAPPVVKISDFGIARGERAVRVTAAPPPTRLSAQMRAARSTVREEVPLTLTGVVMGTPLYMAPETIDGAREATPAVDLFAFGVIAYELLTRRAPFRDSPAFAQLDGLSVAPPPPLVTLRNDLPRAVADIVERCLAFAPEERPNAREVLAVLSKTGSSRTLAAAGGAPL
jgi:hypothetical protein